MCYYSEHPLSVSWFDFIVAFFYVLILFLLDKSHQLQGNVSLPHPAFVTMQEFMQKLAFVFPSFATRAIHYPGSHCIGNCLSVSY